MDTKEFLSVVWGDFENEDGLSTILAVKGDNGKFRHKHYNTLTEAAQAVQVLSNAGYEVYHACALYEPGSRRNHGSVKAVKALWLDIDVGEGKPYDSIEEAMDAVEAFAKRIGLPAPLMINSGGGVHVYWPLETYLEKEVWQKLASGLKSVAKTHNLYSDPARTSDSASILRPVETNNHKYVPSKPVQLGRAYAAGKHLLKIKDAYNILGIADDDINASELPAHLQQACQENTLASGLEYESEPADADVLIQSCGALADFKASKGVLSEPAWYYGMGVLLHCKDGEALCHEWSSGHPEYSEHQTQKKIDQLKNVGPTKCSTMADHFEACNTCPFRNRITTPLQIGRQVAATATEIKLDTEHGTCSSDASGEVFQIPQLPPGYRVGQRNGRYAIYGISNDPDEEDTEVIPTLLYVEHFVLRDDEKHMLLCERTTDRGTRRVELPFSSLAQRGPWMSLMLGAGMAVNDKNAQRVKNYVQGWVTLEGGKDASTINTYSHMGWHGKSFLLGAQLYRPDGSIELVQRSDNANAESKGLGPSLDGSCAEWVRITDRLFNQPNMEHFQFTLMCAFASPLLHFLNDHGGLVVYSHSDDGGHGKTTAESAALSVWGTWKERTRSLNSTTEIAFQTLLGTMCHLPVVYDELTNYPSDKVSQFIHLVNSGQPKARATRTGGVAKREGFWDMIVCSSGNMLMSDKLASVKSNSSAEMSRVFEYPFPKLQSSLSVAEGAALMEELEGHVGHAGDVYIRYVVTHQKEISDTLHQLRQKITSKYALNGQDRYRARLLAAIMCALQITTRTRLTQFDNRALLKWVVSMLALQRQTVEATALNPVTKFNGMLAEITPDVLVTMGDANTWGAGSLSHARPEIISQPRGPVKGWTCIPHMLQSNQGPTRRYIFTSAIRDWCVSKGESYNGLMSKWQEAKLLSSQIKKNEPYGSGVPQYAHNRADMVQVLDTGEAATSGKVTKLAVI